MDNVIELLSSSPPATTLPQRKQASSLSTARRLVIEKFQLSDEFDETGSIDFEIDRSSKRRRQSPELEPKPQRRGVGPAVHLGLEAAWEISSDDDGDLPGVGSGAGGQPGKRPPMSQGKLDPGDEITFSSSAPERRHIENKRPGTSRHISLGKSPGGSWDDLAMSSSQPIMDGSTPEPYSRRTASILANLTQDPTRETTAKPRHPRSASAVREGSAKLTAHLFDEIEFSSSPAHVQQPKPSKSSEAQKAAKAAEKAAAKALRDAEKGAEKEQKRLERERKAREKQKAADLALVNKSRTNKKDAVSEMIVDVSSALKDTSVGNQVEEYMKNSSVEVNYIDDGPNLNEDLRYGNILMWRRNVTSTYNDEDGQWEPASRSRISKEKHVLIYLPAVDFAALLAGGNNASETRAPLTEAQMKVSLDAHVALMRLRFAECIPIYLIEGLAGWLKKNANAKNRAYTAAVRAQMAEIDTGSSSLGESGGTQTKSRKRKKPSTDTLDLSAITPDVVDDLLLHLQLAHQPILIHQTVSPATTASQISTLTQHLATRPYRLAQLDYNLKSASFCMDSGQVRTGDDARDTFVKMLQEVQRVTPSMAYGIVDKFETVRQLVQGFDRHGNLLLEDVRKSVNKDGGWSDRRLGPMISKRLYKVFMGRDPSTTDGMS